MFMNCQKPGFYSVLMKVNFNIHISTKHYSLKKKLSLGLSIGPRSFPLGFFNKYPFHVPDRSHRQEGHCPVFRR